MTDTKLDLTAAVEAALAAYWECSTERTLHDQIQDAVEAALPHLLAQICEEIALAIEASGFNEAHFYGAPDFYEGVMRHAARIARTHKENTK